MLVMEHSIDSSLRTYCPYKDCSCLLERPDEEEEAAAGGQDFPFECPACQRTFCLSCSITGWHTVRMGFDGEVMLYIVQGSFRMA
jgi:hypothetical protein